MSWVDTCGSQSLVLGLWPVSVRGLRVDNLVLLLKESVLLLELGLLLRGELRYALDLVLALVLLSAVLDLV